MCGLGVNGGSTRPLDLRPIGSPNRANSACLVEFCRQYIAGHPMAGLTKRSSVASTDVGASKGGADVAVSEPRLTDQAFLQGVGSRVRELRERRGMTRKALAREADVSERYLGQLEGGEGNISIVLLRHVTAALGAKLTDVLEPEQKNGAERRLLLRLL